MPDGRGVDTGELRRLTGDLRQLASVRPIVLDDGPERGVRTLAFSTGGGLDFWVMADRSLDIGPLWWRGAPVAWQGAAGLRSPYLSDAERDGGRGFNRGFGGLLVTCGLDHIRQPSGPHPLHGRLPYTPARVLARGEDWSADPPILFAEGEVAQAAYGGEVLVLRRRIEAPIGGAELSIVDRVENRGAALQAHALLYHFNFGYPAVRNGTVVRLGDAALLGPVALADPDGFGPATCHAAGGAAHAATVLASPGGFTATVGFATATLPFVQVWRDLRPNAGVIAIEPCTSARTADGDSAGDRPLAPGEARTHAVRLAFAGAPPDPFAPDGPAKGA